MLVTLGDVQAALVSLSLGVTRHHELWGAIRVVTSGLDQVVRIAVRDYERYGRLRGE